MIACGEYSRHWQALVEPVIFARMPAEDARDNRLQDITTVVALLLVAMVAIVLAGAALLPADPAPVPADVVRDFLPFNSAVRPEPTERRLFFVTVMLLPFLAAAGAWRIGRRPSVTKARVARASAAGASVLAAAAIANAPGTRRMFRLEEPLAAGIVGVLAAGATWWFMRRAHTGRADDARGFTRWLPIICIAALLVPALAWRALPVEALRSSFRHYANLDVVLSPVVQSVAGARPLVDFTSQYGLYAVLLAPWFQMTGLSVASFTLTLVALQLVASIALAIVVVREMRSGTLAVVAVAALVFLSGGYVPARFDPDPYLQYWPIRFLWPAIATLLVQQWIRTGRTSWLVGTSLAGGLALVWNIDSGVAVAGAWLALLLTQSVAAALQRRKARWSMLAVATALVTLPPLLLAAWLTLRGGTPVNFGSLLADARRFYVTGFFMVPLPHGLHAWQLVGATYLGAMVVGMSHSLGRLSNPRAILIHFLAFLGIGLFAYYQGRSADQVLAAASWPAVLIVFLCADWLFALRRDGVLRGQTDVVMTAAAVVFGVWCVVVLMADAPVALRLASRNWSARAPTPVTRNVEFIKAHSPPQQPVVVVSRFQATYAAQTGLPSALRGHAVGESVARSMGRDHAGQVDSLRPALLFLGVPYLENSERNPYLDLLPILARHYQLSARTTGLEELHLYTRR